MQEFNFPKYFGFKTAWIHFMKCRGVFVTTCPDVKESKHH